MSGETLREPAGIEKDKDRAKLKKARSSGALDSLLCFLLDGASPPGKQISISSSSRAAVPVRPVCHRGCVTGNRCATTATQPDAPVSSSQRHQRMNTPVQLPPRHWDDSSFHSFGLSVWPSGNTAERLTDGGRNFDSLRNFNNRHVAEHVTA